MDATLLCHNISTKTMPVNSSELLLNIIILPLKGYAAALLSAYNQKLLASFYEFAEIYINDYILEA